ncbi:unnamed protein product, partial [Polarella glacialis]
SVFCAQAADGHPERARYARSMVASATDLARWFPNYTVLVLQGSSRQIALQDIASGLGLGETGLWAPGGSGLFGKEAIQHGVGLYNPSLAPARKAGHLLVVFRASNWHYCPHSGWDGNWSRVPHHEAQAHQFNRPIVALVSAADLRVVEAAPVDFPRSRFLARFQEVQHGRVLAERQIEGPEDLRIYSTKGGVFWLSFSFRTAFLARLGLRLCLGSSDCQTAAWLDTSSLIELTPEALSRKEHREQQAFKNMNLVEFLNEQTALVEFSVNPRVLLKVDLVSGLWQELSTTVTPSLPRLPTSQFFYRGGFCCVGPVALGGEQVRLGAAHIKFNRYVFLHRIYAVRTVATSPEVCFHFAGRAGLPWHGQLGAGCETLQFVAGMVLLPSQHDQEEQLLLSMGVSDCESSFVSIPLGAVLSLLEPAESFLEGALRPEQGAFAQPPAA